MTSMHPAGHVQSCTQNPNLFISPSISVPSMGRPSAAHLGVHAPWILATLQPPNPPYLTWNPCFDPQPAILPHLAYLIPPHECTDPILIWHRTFDNGGFAPRLSYSTPMLCPAMYISPVPAMCISPVQNLVVLLGTSMNPPMQVQHPSLATNHSIGPPVAPNLFPTTRQHAPSTDGLAPRTQTRQFTQNYTGKQSPDGPMRKLGQMFNLFPLVQSSDPPTEQNQSKVRHCHHCQYDCCIMTREKESELIVGLSRQEARISRCRSPPPPGAYDLEAELARISLEHDLKMRMSIIDDETNSATSVSVSPSLPSSQHYARSWKEDEGNPELSLFLNLPKDESFFYEWRTFPSNASLPQAELDAQSGDNPSLEGRTNLIGGSNLEEVVLGNYIKPSI